MWRFELNPSAQRQNVVFGSKSECSWHAREFIFKDATASRSVSWSRKQITQSCCQTPPVSVWPSPPPPLPRYFLISVHLLTVWEVSVCLLDRGKANTLQSHFPQPDGAALISHLSCVCLPQQDVPSSAFHAVWAGFVSQTVNKSKRETHMYTHVTEPNRSCERFEKQNKVTVHISLNCEMPFKYTAPCQFYIFSIKYLSPLSCISHPDRHLCLYPSIRNDC